jgi:hypothetical protein
MRNVSAAIAVSTSLLALLIACSSASLRPAGTSCTSDAECAAGLSCLGLVAQVSDAGACANAAMACSKGCLVDSDCAAVGATFKCFPACSGGMSCGQTQ